MRVLRRKHGRAENRAWLLRHHWHLHGHRRPRLRRRPPRWLRWRPRLWRCGGWPCLLRRPCPPCGSRACCGGGCTCCGGGRTAATAVAWRLGAEVVVRVLRLRRLVRPRESLLWHRIQRHGRLYRTCHQQARGGSTRGHSCPMAYKDRSPQYVAACRRCCSARRLPALPPQPQGH